MESQPLPQDLWLAQTKLQRPRLREDIVPRQRLLDLLHKAMASHRLTLISAPAGYGKTTLATSLAHTAADLRCTWLALDEEDNRSSLSPTVKTHVSRILGKLNVQSRSRAAAARDLHFV